jgi:single-strand DNA-binding protein
VKDINKVILVGRLGADPVHRFTKTGIPVSHFSVATSRKSTKDDPEKPGEFIVFEETQWHRIVAWNKQAEACSQYLKKGSAVYLEGYIRSRQYDDKDGINKTLYEIQLETISFLPGRRLHEESAAMPIEVSMNQIDSNINFSEINL